jgi:hypothetical protein
MDIHPNIQCAIIAHSPPLRTLAHLMPVIGSEPPKGTTEGLHLFMNCKRGRDTHDGRTHKDE